MYEFYTTAIGTYNDIRLQPSHIATLPKPAKELLASATGTCTEMAFRPFRISPILEDNKPDY